MLLSQLSFATYYLRVNGILSEMTEIKTLLFFGTVFGIVEHPNRNIAK